MIAEIELITPEKAAEYLELNISNRPVRENWIVQLQRMIEQGHFKLHHQGIAFSIEGFLIDGQHRLMAIVRAKKAVQMLVTRNVASDTILSMDDHQRRTVADSMTLSRKEQIGNESIAIIRAGLEFSGFINGQGSRLTKTEIDAVYDEFVPALQWVLQEMPTRIEKGVGGATTKAAIMLAWFYCDLERLAEFAAILTGRVMPTSGEDRAAVVLREALLKSGMKTGQSRHEFFRKTQRAIKAFMEREELQRLYNNSEVYYPWPLEEPVRTAATVANA